MGDRISISFVNGATQSPALFSHWGGTYFLEDVELYLNELREEISNLDHPNSLPLDRLEPGTVMVDFIRWMAERELRGDHIKRLRITSALYLGKDSEDGDNSDKGHVEIDLADRDNSWHIYCNCGNPSYYHGHISIDK